MTLERETLRNIIEIVLLIKTLLIFLWGRYTKHKEAHNVTL